MPSERADIIAILTDPDQTIRSVIAFSDGDGFRSELAAALGRVERLGERVERPGERTDGHGSAPVLRIPRLLNPEHCRASIAPWEGSHEPGTVGLSGHYGEVVYRTATNRICYDHALRDAAARRQMGTPIAG